MEAWAWITAYLVGFALLQLALYRYFRQDDSAGSRQTRPSEHTSARADAGTEQRPDSPSEPRSDSGADASSRDEEDAIHCKHCGALNERHSTFNYCRECAQPLR